MMMMMMMMMNKDFRGSGHNSRCYCPGIYVGRL